MMAVLPLVLLPRDADRAPAAVAAASDSAVAADGPEVLLPC